MNNTTYSAGTLSVGAGSTSVSGVGTAWLTSGVRAGDALLCAGQLVIIASVNSATSLTLKRPWPGAAQSAVNYDILLLDDEVRSLVAANALLQVLGSGTLTAFGSVAGAANQLPYFSGVGAFATTTLTAAARSLLDDASIAAMCETLGLVKTNNQTDVTSGRLMRVGDFGWGVGPSGNSVPSLTDLDTTTPPSGLYRVNEATTLAGTWPSDVTTTYDKSGLVLTLRYDGGSFYQLFLSLGTQRLYWRRRSGSWSSWRHAVDHNNILGTVSLSGGVPTGAIIERGSNANGEYVKFADGTMICWQTTPGVDCTEAVGQMFRHSEALVWTYPAAFVAPPCVKASAGQTGRWAAVGAPAHSNCGYRIYGPVSNAALTEPRLMAIGRWY